MQPPTIIAAGFVTPAFAVAGLALISIPIIIHILNRRRFRTVPWAAMEFLLRALRKNRRRLKFEQWLLLAMRCLVVLLAGLALARPVGCQRMGLASLAATPSGLHVLVIDNSYSMAYQADRPGARTHLDQARRVAAGIVQRLSPGGESVAIITASQPATAVLASPTYDLDAARSAIERIEQSSGGTDLPGALRLALDMAADATGQPRRSLYILSDSTRSAWEGRGIAPALAELGPAVARQFDVTHFGFGQADQWNHSVLSLGPASNLVTSKFPAAFSASLGGFGGPADAMLQWRLGEQVLSGGGRIRIEGTADVSQPSVSFRGGGHHVVSAAVASDDRLAVDDARHRVIDVAASLKVLIVEGERGLRPMEGSAAFLALALSPPHDPSTSDSSARSTSYVEPEVISDLELGNRVLADYRAVIMAGVGQVQPAQADQLRHYVQQGGSLIVFVGDQVSGENYNTVLLPRGLLPGPMVKRVAAAGENDAFHFDFVPTADLHPLLAEFRNQENSGLGTARIFSYWQIDLAAGSNAERVLDFQPTGEDDTVRHDPAITLHPLGAGRVVFVATAADADAEWSFLPAKPAYVALVHEMLAGSVRPDDAWLNLTVGQPLVIPSTVRLSSAPQLTDPSGRAVTLEQTSSEEGQPLYRSAPLAASGMYWLSAGDRSYPVAVNVPPDEADVRTIDDAAIRRTLGNIEMTFHRDQLPADTSAEDEEASGDFGWSVMLVVLALLGAEAVLAMRFGHYRTGR